MLISRREYLQTAAAAVAGASFLSADQDATQLGIPGPFRGRVVSVHHPNCFQDEKYQAEPIRTMVSSGMCELTGAKKPVDAWRTFFRRGDVVGIKVSPVGQPFVASSPEMLHAVIDGVLSAGVRPSNIVVYERYKEIIDNMGLKGWLPPQVKLAWASPAYSDYQLDIDGYDPKHYFELPFTIPMENAGNIAAVRSYAAKFITRDVTKLINLPVLKSHNAAGVTLALKNLSHGLFNNVNRSHQGQLRIAEFTPAAVSLPVVRNKTVLNILDGTRALYHGGPGIVNNRFIWDHKTVYFATDPVAMDKIGWSVIDAQRAKNQLEPVAAKATDDVWKSPDRQPEHIDNAGAKGLGEADMTKIDLRPIQLS